MAPPVTYSARVVAGDPAGEGHVQLQVYAGPAAGRASTGRLTMRGAEALQLEQLLRDHPLNTCLPGEHLQLPDLGIGQPCRELYWRALSCARGDGHRGQHVALDGDGFVVAVWLPILDVVQDGHRG